MKLVMVLVVYGSLLNAQEMPMKVRDVKKIAYLADEGSLEKAEKIIAEYDSVDGIYFDDGTAYLTFKRDVVYSIGLQKHPTENLILFTSIAPHSVCQRSFEKHGKCYIIKPNSSLIIQRRYVCGKPQKGVEVLKI